MLRNPDGETVAEEFYPTTAKMLIFVTMANIYNERLEALRYAMRSLGLDAVVLTGSDPHGSEYLPERYKQISWLTGFMGEASGAIITQDYAGLWTDSRYFIQAEKELEGSGVTMERMQSRGYQDLLQWFGGSWQSGSGNCGTVGFDPLSTPASLAGKIREISGDSRCLKPVPDLISLIWSDRPEIPQTPVFTLDSEEGRRSKLNRLRRFCREKACDGILISSLDEIAWTLDVRASDIDYNPYAISYLLVTPEDAVWYVLRGGFEDPSSEDALSRISEDGVRIEAYSPAPAILDDFGGKSLFTDVSSLNAGLADYIESNGISIIEGESPVAMLKAVKTTGEIEAMGRAHLLDGIAVEKFLFRLEKALEEGVPVSEKEAALMLRQLREQSEEYISDSFETISAYGAGAALPHYSTPQENSPLLRRKGLFLCDSGGQYLCGTTDITRTVPLGECTHLEKEDYTLALKGFIALSSAVFPEGTPGCRIDALAREPLWRARRDFGHGTGHGVGFLLGVHEGPQSIRQDLNPVALRPGMVVSCEPGIYREGMHGIRHENLLLCTRDSGNEFGDWLCFETLTLCHIDYGAILPELLTSDEMKWLKEYNGRVYETLSPYLDEDEALWLRTKTSC